VVYRLLAKRYACVTRQHIASARTVEIYSDDGHEANYQDSAGGRHVCWTPCQSLSEGRGCVRVTEHPEGEAGAREEAAEPPEAYAAIPSEGVQREAVATLPPLRYEPNPKHKPLPTPGRHGSICPQDVNAQALLSESELVGRKRYATNGLEAFCAQCHDPGRNLWHGYPIAWAEVPPRIRGLWIGSGKVTSRAIRRDRRRIR
jgi:hypothetical protein